MNELISKIFKISAHIKFTNTDCDHKKIYSMIQETGYFNVKQKTTTIYKFGDDLILNTYKDEIFLFKEITIYIIEEESNLDFYIPISYFDTDKYKDKLKLIYNSCIAQQDTSLFRKGSSILRSFVIDNYKEDKNKADTLFLAKKYVESFRIYCKYDEYNDFSHYCIEMSFYCNPVFSRIPYHFIDTFYYNRLIFILFESKEHDYLCYELYKLSSQINKDIMYELGTRFYKTSDLRRKGIELMYFYGSLEDIVLKSIFNGVLLKEADNMKLPTDFKSIENEKIKFALPCTKSPELLNFKSLNIDNFRNLFVVYQYQVLDLTFNIQGSGDYIFNRKKYRFVNIINLKVKFKKEGFHQKTLSIILDKVYHVDLYFAVFEKLKIDIFTDNRLQSLLFISLSGKNNYPIHITSKNNFSLTDSDILKIYKKEILGITDLTYVSQDHGEILNDPIYTDINFNDFLGGDLTSLDIKKDTTIRINRYKKHRIELKIDNLIFKLYISKKVQVKKKLFIFIFNSYILSENTKINLLINNHKKDKYYLEVQGINCQVVDTDFIIKGKICTLFEFRCKNMNKDSSFDVKVRDKYGNFIEHEFVVDLKW